MFFLILFAEFSHGFPFMVTSGTKKVWVQFNPFSCSYLAFSLIWPEVSDAYPRLNRRAVSKFRTSYQVVARKLAVLTAEGQNWQSKTALVILYMDR